MLRDIASCLKLCSTDALPPFENESDCLVVYARNTLANFILVGKLLLGINNRPLGKEAVLLIAK